MPWWRKKYWEVWLCKTRPHVLRVQGAGWGLMFNDTNGKAKQNRLFVSHHHPHVMKTCLLNSYYCTHYKPHPLICTWFLSTQVPFIVFSDSCTGGMGPLATVVCKRIAALLSEKNGQCYRRTLYWLRCKLSFSLLRSAVTCLRVFLPAFCLCRG